MLNLFIVAAEYKKVEALEILSVEKRNGVEICTWLLSETHEGTWCEEEGARLLYNALLPIKEPANLWASECLDKALLKAIADDLNGMGCRITIVEGRHPDLTEYELGAWDACHDFAEFG